MSDFDLTAVTGDPRTRVVVCCGTGGVGKTSVSAALALAAADAGRRVVLLTVDPAKRLATALGLAALGSTPQAVAGVDTTHGGSLDALMLDMKRTFDEALDVHAPGAAGDKVRANPFYEAISTSLSGTQDYMATEKLGQLHDELLATGRWDLIVVDTPPSRSALDFLASPERLDALASGLLMRALVPQGPFKLLSLPLRQLTGLIGTVIGSTALADLQVFAEAFEKVMAGFRQRADRVRKVLASPETAFVLVATPKRVALTEAAYFADELTQRHATRARGLVVNRMAQVVDLTAGDQRLLASVPDLEAWWQRSQVVRRAQEQAIEAHAPALPTRRVDDLPFEVTDVASVRLLGAALLGGAAQQHQAPTLDV